LGAMWCSFWLRAPAKWEFEVINKNQSREIK
jgi:hypothetical protein